MRTGGTTKKRWVIFSHVGEVFYRKSHFFVTRQWYVPDIPRGKYEFLVALGTHNGLGQDIFLRFLVLPGVTRDKRLDFPQTDYPRPV